MAPGLVTVAVTCNAYVCEVSHSFLLSRRGVQMQPSGRLGAVASCALGGFSLPTRTTISAGRPITLHNMATTCLRTLRPRFCHTRCRLTFCPLLHLCCHASNGLAGATQVDLERTQDELLDDVHQRIRKAKVDGGLVPPNPARGERDRNMPRFTEMCQVSLPQQSLPSPRTPRKGGRGRGSAQPHNPRW